MNISDANAKEIVSESVKKAVLYCGSQARLAQKAKISQGAVSKYIRKEALPTGVTARKLAKAVDNTQTEADFAPLIFSAPVGAYTDLELPQAERNPPWLHRKTDLKKRSL